MGEYKVLNNNELDKTAGGGIYAENITASSNEGLCSQCDAKIPTNPNECFRMATKTLPFGEISIQSGTIYSTYCEKCYNNACLNQKNENMLQDVVFLKPNEQIN